MSNSVEFLTVLDRGGSRFIRAKPRSGSPPKTAGKGAKKIIVREIYISRTITGFGSWVWKYLHNGSRISLSLREPGKEICP
jgi:hypothetical protein